MAKRPSHLGRTQADGGLTEWMSSDWKMPGAAATGSPGKHPAGLVLVVTEAAGPMATEWCQKWDCKAVPLTPESYPTHTCGDSGVHLAKTLAPVARGPPPRL